MEETKMKKKLLGLGLVTVLAIGLAACGGNKEASDKGKAKEDDKTIVVGASPTPHAEILEEAKPLLKEKGYDLEVKVFQDYVLPNKALEQKEIDANYFQHIPYLEKEILDKGYDFANAGSIHIEKMAFYSKNVKSADDVKDGATVLVSNSQSDWGRVITILQDAGLVKVKDGVELTKATFDDIEENPKNLKFKYDIDPAILTTAYQNDEADLIAINANFAENIGLNPEKDGVFVEKDNSPYANVIATRTEDKDSEKIKALIEVLHSEKIKDFITEKWNGTISVVQ
jgi:D-methionine transport system substrate-binding protein